jgi:hypothetical protein
LRVGDRGAYRSLIRDQTSTTLNKLPLQHQATFQKAGSIWYRAIDQFPSQFRPRLKDLRSGIQQLTKAHPLHYEDGSNYLAPKLLLA